MQKWFAALVKLGLPANEAAVEALKFVRDPEYRKNSAVAQRLRAAAAGVSKNNFQRFFVAVSLSEGETIRRMLHDHTRQEILRENKAIIGLRTVSGRLLDGSPNFVDSSSKFLPPSSDSNYENHTSFCCYRFCNTDMYYSEVQIKSLSKALSLAPLEDRLSFFEEGLRLRVRERNLWADTPVAKLFTAEDEWHLLSARSIADRLRGVFGKIHNDGGNIPTTTLIRIFASAAQKEANSKTLATQGLSGPGADGSGNKASTTRGIHNWTPSEKSIGECIFEHYAGGSKDSSDVGMLITGDSTLSVESFARLCQDLKITNVKLVDVIQLFKTMVNNGGEEDYVMAGVDQNQEGAPDQITLMQFSAVFPVSQKHAHLPAECALNTDTLKTDRQEIWFCLSCTFANAMNNEECAVCGIGWDGRRHVPRDQWYAMDTILFLGAIFFERCWCILGFQFTSC